MWLRIKCESLKFNHHMISNMTTHPATGRGPSLSDPLSITIMSAEHSNPQNLPYQDDGPDGFYYSTVGQEKDLALLPDFFLPALEHSLAMKQVKKLPAVANASATVSNPQLSYIQVFMISLFLSPS